MNVPPPGRAPEAFRRAVASLQDARLRGELSMTELPAPARLAPCSHALSLAATVSDDEVASGRLVILHDPAGVPAWQGPFRIVIFATAELDAEIAADPMLPDVGWSWLTDSLQACGVPALALGGTVTATSSTRYGDIAGPQRTSDLEIRASWTAEDENLAPHVAALGELLAVCAGLPPEGVTTIPHMIHSNVRS